MFINRIQNAKDELLREAKKAGNQICRMKNESGSFIKARRGYSHPDDIRLLYNQAFETLVREGKLKMVLRNKDLELFELTRADGHVVTKSAAKEILLQAIQQGGHIFKIHSPDGEFVQVGQKAYCDIDDERIVFLEALYELMRQGRIHLLSDSKELSTFEAKRSQYADYYEHQMDGEAGRFAA